MNELTSGLATSPKVGWIGQWSPGIGDPTIVGWLTVGFYLLAVWQCYRVATRYAHVLRAHENTIWWILVYGLLALGLNKQLDLQSAFTEIGRMIATQQGWYEQRYKVQVIFIYGVAMFATVVAIALAFIARKAPLATYFTLLGCICLLGFVLMRAASFHHFDLFINHVAFGSRMNWIMEIGGLLIISTGAYWRSLEKVVSPR